MTTNAHDHTQHTQTTLESHLRAEISRYIQEANPAWGARVQSLIENDWGRVLRMFEEATAQCGRCGWAPCPDVATFAQDLCDDRSCTLDLLSEIKEDHHRLHATGDALQQHGGEFRSCPMRLAESFPTFYGNRSGCPPFPHTVIGSLRHG